MFHLIEAKSLPLTKDLVEQYYAMEPSPTERQLDPSRLKYLREKADAGKLVTFHWATAQLGSRTLRMNGQHSSTMLKEMNGTFPEGLTVHLDSYKVDTASDLAELFRQFDARKSGRSAADVSGAYQGLHDDLKDVPREIAKLAVEGIAWHDKNIEGTRSGLGDDQYQLFENLHHHGFVKWMGKIHSIKTLEMKQIQVAAAMYATFMTNESEARTFWESVARGGVEFEDQAPATVLDAWLKEARKTDEKRRMHLKPGNYYQGSVYAWNAFREEKPIKDIRYKVDKGFLPLTH